MDINLERMYWSLPYELRRTLLKVMFSKHYSELQTLRQRTPKHGAGATLEPFAKHKCIFVHIPKTAGTSVSLGLFGSRTGLHRKIAGYQAAFSQREYDSYFKFTFVRNPWDRVASAYFFLKQGGRYEGSRRWAAKHLAPYPTFDAFVRGWLKPEHVRLGYHFTPQVDYLFLPGKRTSELDFIGSYENLRGDYEHICSVLGTGEALPEKISRRENKKTFARTTLLKHERL